MSEYSGSLINNLYAGAGNPEPEVGMGATRLCWTDRHACTIIEVTRNQAGVATAVRTRADKVVRVDTNGVSDAQSYRYEPGDQPGSTIYTRRRNGCWVRKGDSMKGGERLLIGKRDHYYDHSF